MLKYSHRRMAMRDEGLDLSSFFVALAAVI
jgi:hypothetical protein